MASFQAQQVTAQLREVIESPDVPNEVKTKLKEVERVANTPLQTDVWIYRALYLSWALWFWSL